MIDDDDDDDERQIIEALMQEPQFQERFWEFFRRCAERDRRPPNLRVEINAPCSEHPCGDTLCREIRQSEQPDFCAWRWVVVDDDPVGTDACDAIEAFGFSSLKEAEDYADDINERWRSRNAN